MGGAFKFNTQVLNDYLELVEDTESPRLFHIWSLLSGIAGSMGRRCWLRQGSLVTYPNHYVLLVGTPGTRKSTSASMIQRQLRKSTGIKFAPKDTGGQFQGLLVAMGGDESEEKAQAKFVEAAALAAETSLAGLTLSGLASLSDRVEDASPAIQQSLADKHHMMVIASEFSTFLKRGSETMVDFLTEMWDGSDYDYRTKQGQTILKDPLLNLLGCTTPTTLASILPVASVGHGFLSRFILVYGSRRYKKVPWPSKPSDSLSQQIQDTLAAVYHEMNGEFEITPQAKDCAISLYDAPSGLTDSRFAHYHERRATHLNKVAMGLCAGRGTMILSDTDYLEAHRILKATERGMPDALGEFGLNPLASVKQSVLEYIRASHAVSLAKIHASFHRDAKTRDITEVLSDLAKSNQIQLMQHKDGSVTVHATMRKDSSEDEMMQLLRGDN